MVVFFYIVSGTSNDGNTARRFFENPAVSAKITGLNEELIHRFYIILQVVSSGLDVDILKYDKYAMDTAKLYIRLYDWYYMSPTVHKYLMHGGEIIKNAIVPIGQLSEEAQEARNKEFRQYRENHSRKNSRLNTNEDLVNNLLISSDPYISNLRVNHNRIKKDLHQDALNLIK